MTASSGLHTLSVNSIGSIRRQLSHSTPSPSDFRRAFARRPSEHPSARRMTVDLVQAGHLHRRSTLRLALPRGSAWKHRQDASNSLLQPTFRVTSTRRNTTFGDLSTAAGEPAGSTFEDLSRPRRFRRSVEKDAGPPFGHPASDGRAIDGARPASVCSALSREARFRAEGENRRSFVGCRTDLPGKPLAPFQRAGEGGRNRTRCRSCEPASTGARQRRRLLRARGTCHRKSRLSGRARA